MKAREVYLTVTDHAVLRYLERRHGVDIEAIRQHLAGIALNAAQLGAVAVRAENVRLFLRDNEIVAGRTRVSVVTVGTVDMRRGLGRGAPADD